ncbi:ATP-dependent DNA helicase [Arcanobacterium phocae]|uniref:ATP-dependent DNA helicase n=1 Tax=Arcanobacterium phocae TaxID=131112 RepID=UPI001C0EBA00|nr:ATP-dependent DNA helicase [Arcanobacterium phocae]
MTSYEQFIETDQFPPTEEQKAVITSTHRATLVIAGAGSGKTATMANRIAWLLASGQAQPQDILGLTFTRKAAGELADRVNRKIAEISARGLFKHEPTENDVASEVVGPDAESRVRETINREASRTHAYFERPTISTYNAFASNIATSYAMLIGEDPGARLMNEAERYQLMFDIVAHSAIDDALADKSIDGLTDAALSLAAGLIDNDVTVDEAHRFLEEEAQAVDEVLSPRLSPKSAPDKGSMERVQYDRAKTAFTRKSIVKSLEARVHLLECVRLYQEQKKSLGLIEFADQVSWATRILENVPEVRTTLATKFSVVLLDEYQDTSVNQARFLHAAFGQAQSVTAVGDPNQAIYGWRGASANAFSDFIRDYEVPQSARLSLSQAFRNATTILDAANRITQGKLSYEGLSIKSLRPRSGAPAGEVTRIHRHYARDTYKALAQRLSVELKKKHDGHFPTAAVLVRNHSFENDVIAALEEYDVPFEVIGGQSSIVRPEIRAVRALLTVAEDSQRNDQLMYLFNFFGIGIADIRVFSDYAVEHTRQEQDFLLNHISAKSSTDIDTRSLREQLGRPNVSLVSELLAGNEISNMSAEAQQRIEHIRSLVVSIQQERQRGIEHLVSSAIKKLDLPIYAATRVKGSASIQAALASFVKLAGTYANNNPLARIGGFLSWIDAIESHEHSGELSTAADASVGYEIEPSAGVVQILTVNAAKGLEWDIVAIPELVNKRFDYQKNRYPFWHKQLGMFPFPLRADKEHIPHFSVQDYLDIDDAQMRKCQALVDYGFYDESIRSYAGDEERRLAYVAVTRPRTILMLLTYDFKDPADALKQYQSVMKDAEDSTDISIEPGNQSDSEPIFFVNTFISDLEGSTQQDEHYQEPFVSLEEVSRWGQTQGFSVEDSDALSHGEGSAEFIWPDSVDRSVEARSGGYPFADIDIEPILDMWKATYERLRQEYMQDDLGNRVERNYLTASDVVSLMNNADQFYRDQRRPIPQPSTRASRTGTSVHAAIAAHFNAPLTLDIDSVLDVSQMPIDIDTDLSEIDVELFRTRFEKSRFASLPPLAIEQALEVYVAGFPVRCVIDAVFDTSDDPHSKPVTIVDWKTGKRPALEQLHSRELQLGLYRLAWAKSHNIDLANIDACFYYLGEKDPSRREIHAGELSEKDIEQAIAQALIAGQGAIE